MQTNTQIMRAATTPMLPPTAAYMSEKGFTIKLLSLLHWKLMEEKENKLK